MKEYIIGKLKQIFYKNPQIHNISKSVITKLKQIKTENVQSVEFFKALINSHFPGIEVPQFLIQNLLITLESMLFYSERNIETSRMISKVKNRQFIKDSEKLILFFESIKKNNNLILEGINGKFNLLYLFILFNYSVFKKKFFNKDFFVFLKINEEIIKKYFSQSFDYLKIYKEIDSMNKTLINNKKKQLY